MQVDKGARIHLIGICGTAMAGLAGLLRARGYTVTGSDEGVYPPMSTYLSALGIEAGSGFDERSLEPPPALVIIGNAVRRGNPEAERTLDERLPFTSLPALVREMFLPGRRVAVAAGTHGKTTTSSMLAHILAATGRDPSFLIGGIPIGAGVPARLGEGAAFVLEGDEYDTAFFDKGPKLMHYLPDVAILGAVEMDHADIYRDLEMVKLQFRRWVNIIPRRSLLILHGDDPNAVEVATGALCRVERFGEGKGNDWRMGDLREDMEGTSFTLSVPAQAPGAAGQAGTVAGRAGADAGPARPSVRTPTAGAFNPPGAPGAAGQAGTVAGRAGVDAGPALLNVRIPTAGAFNARNAVAALVAARELGVHLAHAAEAISSFPGVRRRLEVRGVARGVTVVDDFAHHPTAIRETLRAARARWPRGRVVAVLEPRSWSLRRNLFQAELPTALAAAHVVWVAPVYHGEMLPAPERLDVPRLVADVRGLGVPAHAGASAEAIVGGIVPDLQAGDVVLVMSNGGFDGIHDRLLAALRA